MAKLHERAMLVQLRISKWEGGKSDKEVTFDTCSRHGASLDAGSWRTYFLPKAEIKNLRKYANKVKTAWKKDTLPWDDAGTRVLPSDLFFKYRQRVVDAIEEFDNEVDEFITKRYPQIVKHMPERLKGLLKGKQLPTPKEIRSKFGIAFDISPIPTFGEDFRLGLEAEEEAKIKAEMQKSLEGKTKQAMTDVWRQMEIMIGKIEDTLSQPDKRFHDSLIGNLIDLCLRLPKFNITDDEQVETMRQEAIEKLCFLKPDNLRQNKTERKAAAKSAKEVLGKLQQYAVL